MDNENTDKKEPILYLDDSNTMVLYDNDMGDIEVKTANESFTITDQQPGQQHQVILQNVNQQNISQMHQSNMTPMHMTQMQQNVNQIPMAQMNQHDVNQIRVNPQSMNQMQMNPQQQMQMNPHGVNHMQLNHMQMNQQSMGQVQMSRSVPQMQMSQQGINRVPINQRQHVSPMQMNQQQMMNQQMINQQQIISQQNISMQQPTYCSPSQQQPYLLGTVGRQPMQVLVQQHVSPQMVQGQIIQQSTLQGASPQGGQHGQHVIMQQQVISPQHQQSIVVQQPNQSFKQQQPTYIISRPLQKPGPIVQYIEEASPPSQNTQLIQQGGTVRTVNGKQVNVPRSQGGELRPQSQVMQISVQFEGNGANPQQQQSVSSSKAIEASPSQAVTYSHHQSPVSTTNNITPYQVRLSSASSPDLGSNTLKKGPRLTAPPRVRPPQSYSQNVVNRAPMVPNRLVHMRGNLPSRGGMAMSVRGGRMVGPTEAAMSFASPSNRMPRYSQPNLQPPTLTVQQTTKISDAEANQTSCNSIVSSSVPNVSSTPNTASTSMSNPVSGPMSNPVSGPVSNPVPVPMSGPLPNTISGPMPNFVPGPPRKLSLDDYKSRQVMSLGRGSGNFVQQRFGNAQVTSKQVLLVYNNNNSRSQQFTASNPCRQGMVKLQHQDETGQHSPNSSSGISGAPTSTTYVISKDMHTKRLGGQVLCVNCGVNSEDFATCQHCHSPLPKNARVIPNTTTSTAQSVVTKDNFYGNTNQGNKKSDTQANSTKKPATKSQRGKGRGRTRAYDEPEILTLSSDDESTNDSSTTGNGHNNSMASSQNQNNENNSAVNSSSSGGNLGGMEKLQKMVAVVGAREPLVRALDEAQLSQGDGELCKKTAMDNFNGSLSSHIRMSCRNARIGSYRTTPTSAIVFAKDVGIRISVLSLPPGSKEVDVNITVEEVLKVLFYYGKQMPVMYIYLGAKTSYRIRKVLGMHEDSLVYYDPASTDNTRKRIVLMFDKINDDEKSYLKTMFKYKAPPKNSGSSSNKLNISRTVAAGDESSDLEVMEEITYDEANAILVAASAPEVQAAIKKTAKQVVQSAPQQHESKTLFIYPFPPQKGGISVTIDDYSVLEEESFLNDVILDFYLKWVLYDKLSEELRNKVHVFSTFFYKRLTCKPKKMRRHHPVEDNPKLSPAEKRHERVKSWTKNVDIFEKDYIIIPINEHAHWFLAIICFPWLEGPVHFSSGEPLDSATLLKANQSNNRRKRKTKRVPEIPIIDDGEWSERDEAEGDENEFDDEDYDDDMEPRFKKAKSDVIPGIGDDTPAPEAPKEEEIPPIKQPCIIVFDSLTGGNRSRIVATLRDYLTVEYKKRKEKVRVFNKDTMKGACPKVPQQTNYSDCGLYTLQFTESFFEMPVQDYRLPIKTLQNWFDQSLVAGKREGIANLIKELMHTYNPQNKVQLPDIYFNSPEEREKGGRASCQVEERERAERLAIEKSREKSKPFVHTAMKSTSDSSEKTKSDNKLDKKKDEKAPPPTPVSATQSNNVTSSASKPTTAKPIIIKTELKTLKRLEQPKKVVLGSIPIAKPFASQTASNRTNISCSSPTTQKDINAKNLLSSANSSALAAIGDCYSFEDSKEEEDSEVSNGNVSSSESRPTPTIATTGKTQFTVLPKTSEISTTLASIVGPTKKLPTRDRNFTVTDKSISVTEKKTTNVASGAEDSIVIEKVLGKKAMLSNQEVLMYIEDSQADKNAKTERESSPVDLYAGLDNSSSLAKDENMEVSDSSTADESPAPTSSTFINSTASPSIFKNNARSTSSGRTIAPPKRYLQNQSTSQTEVKRKKRNNNISTKSTANSINSSLNNSTSSTNSFSNVR